MKKNTIFTVILTAAVALGAVSSARARTKDEILKQADAEVQKICLSMQKYMDRPDTLKKIIVDPDEDINAYATADGTVALLMGMVNFAQSADELAMVCGHEEAHLSRQHYKRSIGSQILATVVDVAIGGTAGDVAGSLIYSKNSRKHERESDKEGLLYAWRAGFDPYAGAELWEGMSMGRNSIAIEKYLSSHPVTKERVENFKVQMYRDCKDGLVTAYCDEVLADKNMEALFNQFQNR